MNITVYSKPACGACDITKQWLDNNNIEYESIDAYEDEEAMKELQKHGFMSSPVVKVDTWDNAWSGFNLERLEKLK